MTIAELVGPSPHDGQLVRLPAGVIAVVLICEDGLDYRAEYAEMQCARVDRDAVSRALAELAAHPILARP